MPTNSDIIRLVVILVALIVLLPLLMMVFAWLMMGPWSGGHMWTGEMSAWSGPLVGLPMLLLLVGVYLLYRVLRSLDSPRKDPAIEEMRLAYARGDLSEEEFEERRARLKGEQ